MITITTCDTMTTIMKIATVMMIIITIIMIMIMNAMTLTMKMLVMFSTKYDLLVSSRHWNGAGQYVVT